MRKLFTTSGRASRRMFWEAHALLVVVICVLFEMLDADFLPGVVLLAGQLSIVPALLFTLVIHIRRWHDRNKSGWWLLINLAPVLGQLWTLVECGFLPGPVGLNVYGDDPTIRFDLSSLKSS